MSVDISVVSSIGSLFLSSGMNLSDEAPLAEGGLPSLETVSLGSEGTKIYTKT